MPVRLSHNVYVVELSFAVLKIGRFRARNPGYVKGQPCVYVGMTGLPPGERFQNHKAGVKANWFVKRYGRGLLPELFAHLNPMPYEAAQRMEQDLADELQEKAWGVAGVVGGIGRPVLIYSSMRTAMHHCGVR